MSLIQRIAASILRVTAQTVALLFTAAADQFERLHLALDRMPTRKELEAAAAALKPGGLLILTVAVKVADEARALLRSISALSMASVEQRPMSKARWSRTANRSADPSRQGFGLGRLSANIDLYARKGALSPIVTASEAPAKVRRIKMPLRIPGGKSRAVGCVLPYVPSSVALVVSPFAGGLWVEGHLAAGGKRVIAYDKDPNLINFWRCAKENISRLTKIVVGLFAEFDGFDENRRAEAFYRLRSRYPTIIEPYERGASWFILNRCCFSGAALRCGYGRKHYARFDRASIQRLRNVDLRRFEFAAQDFRITIDSHPHDFLYLDPVYMNAFGFYGEPATPHWTAQDHLDLFDRLKDRDAWVMHYDRCEQALTLYDGFPMVMVEWRYGMTANTASNEVLILPRVGRP
jgi:DNA adenine methylase